MWGSCCEACASTLPREQLAVVLLMLLPLSACYSCQSLGLQHAWYIAAEHRQQGYEQHALALDPIFHQRKATFAYSLPLPLPPTRFIKGLEDRDMARAQLGLAHSYSRAKVKFNVNKADNMIIQVGEWI